MKKLFFLLLTIISLQVSAQVQPVLFPVDSTLLSEYVMPKLLVNRWRDTTAANSNIYYQATYHSYMEIKGDANAVKIIYTIETVEKIGATYRVISTASRSKVINTKEFVIDILRNPSAATPFVTGNILNPLGFNIHLDCMLNSGAPQSSILAPLPAFTQFLQQMQNP